MQCRMFSSISVLYSLDFRSTHISTPSHDCRQTDSSLVESTWFAGRATHGSEIGSQCRLAFFGRAVHCLQGAPFQAAGQEALLGTPSDSTSPAIPKRHSVIIPTEWPLRMIHHFSHISPSGIQLSIASPLFCMSRLATLLCPQT